MGVSEAGEQRTIGLKATNFGPIVEADIELRPLTVFVGPSNTGKSYLAILIYALHSLFAGYLDRRSWTFVLGSHDRDESHAPFDRGVTVEMAEQMLNWLKTLHEETDSDFNHSVHPLPVDVAELVREAMHSRYDIGSTLRTSLARCFGVGADVGQLIRAGSRGGSQIVIGGQQVDNRSASPSIEHEFSMPKSPQRPSEFKTSVPHGADVALPTGNATQAFMFASRMMRQPDESTEHEAAARASWANSLITSLSDLATAHSAGPLNRPAYYLPADRTGVMHAHRTIVRAVIDRASSTGLVDAPNVPTLSGVMGDFLRELIGIGDDEHPTFEDGDALASALERDVLGGTVAVERTEANYPTFVYRPTNLDRDLPILTSSSMVSELAPVALYLRHYVKPGDTLIIEEPESHLHPAMQAEFALHLVRLVHAGIRVIVTTHSEWVLDQFANLVRLAELSEAERAGLRGADAALSPDDVGFWLFKPNAKRRGSVVQELKVNPDEGGLLSGYDEVADEMYNTWAEIGNRIADRGAE